MSIEEDIKAIQQVCTEMEERLNREIRSILEEHNKGVAANVLINIGTTMLAKAVILVRDEHRNMVYDVVVSALNSKIREGDAAVESLMAIGKAMGDTCQPPPRRH